MDEDQIHLPISGTALDFDSYIENLINEGERKRRLAGQPLELVVIQEDTRIPVQRDRFWSSSSNKEKVQDLCRSSFTCLVIEAGIQLVLSGYISCEDKIIDCTRMLSDRKSVIAPALNHGDIILSRSNNS